MCSRQVEERKSRSGCASTRFSAVSYAHLPHDCISMVYGFFFSRLELLIRQHLVMPVLHDGFHVTLAHVMILYCGKSQSTTATL